MNHRSVGVEDWIHASTDWDVISETLEPDLGIIEEKAKGENFTTR